MYTLKSEKTNSCGQITNCSQSCKKGSKVVVIFCTLFFIVAYPHGPIDKYNRPHYTLMMTWFDIYNEYIKNFEKIIQLQQDYIRNLEQISHFYNEFVKNIERVNKLYNEFITSHEKLSSLYEQQFQNMQRMNQKWLDIFSKPWERYQSEKHKD